MNKRPESKYGTIDFGKDGSVKPNIRQLPDKKPEKEIQVGEEFIAYGKDVIGDGFTVRTLPERDHDFELTIKPATSLPQSSAPGR